MTLSRRQFTGAGLASLAFAGLSRAHASPPAGTAPGYGALQPDPAGYFDLPAGFGYRIISQFGERMSDGFLVPDKFDGMGCLPLDDGLVALVRNHELKPGENGHGPAGHDKPARARLDKAPAFGRDHAGKVLPGGTTTLIYDLRTGKRVEEYLSLAGTAVNCAGGVTPWGSWLTCEETVLASPDTQRSHGWVFEVPARQRGLIEPVPITAMGRFRHEAVAIDPATGIAYLTEDRPDGLFYRFLPGRPGQLAQGGRLQALALAEGGRDSRNWHGADMAPGSWREVRWIDLDDVESPQDDLRLRGHAGGATLFARGEGIHLGVTGSSGGRHEFYFACTSGGLARHGQIFRLVPGVGGASDRLQLFVESTDPEVMDYADNLTVAPWGDLIVCEDRSGDKINHLRGVTPAGQIYLLARLNAPTELAGACFSPDGQTLFVNAYAPGRTLAITGPWTAGRRG